MYAGLDTWPEPPVDGDEATTLVGSLDRQRATFAWKAGGLDVAGLQATVGDSTVTLGGLLKHLALVEDHYFSVRLFDRAPASPFNDVDWDANPNWDWTWAPEDTPESLYELWQSNVDKSRRLIAEALANGGLDQLDGAEVARRQVAELATNLRRPDRRVCASRRSGGLDSRVSRRSRW